MRKGFTTGSCAAAAAKAAAYMLLTGRIKTSIRIDTPGGIVYHAEIEDIKRSEKKVSCAVRKDGGDDPDITTGTLIYASVSIPETILSQTTQLQIEGGVGIGRVTRPGLDQPVGSAAINRIPRSMIEKEVRQVCQAADYRGSLLIELSAPEGEALAKRTFNPRLGIVGGISILGTTGIVEPMSSQALLDTILAELTMRRAEGCEVIGISPGNYGLEYMKQTYGYDLDQSVKCSNFIGDTIDMACQLGFQKLLLTGHIGKLVKLAGGIMNTHSQVADCRMELLAAAGIQAGISAFAAKELLACVTTEEAIGKLAASGRLPETMQIIMDKICTQIRRRAAGGLQLECILYANGYGELSKSSGADQLLELLHNEAEKTEEKTPGI